MALTISPNLHHVLRLYPNYRRRGVKVERSLNRDNITWTVSVQLPESEKAPRPSQVWQSKAWG